MPVFVAWIGEVLLSTVGQMALSALVALGIGFVANAGFSGVINSSQLQSMLGAAGPFVNWIGYFQIDTSMTIVLSAWAGRRITDAAKVHFASLPKAGSGSSGS